jgi:hypothetical protein
MLSKLEYAISLHGLILKVLAAGTGKDQMEKLRSLKSGSSMPSLKAHWH